VVAGSEASGDLKEEEHLSGGRTAPPFGRRLNIGVRPSPAVQHRGPERPECCRD
jgi:hypothetical protein